MRFANPEAFGLLLLIPIYLAIFVQRQARQKGLPFPSLGLLLQQPRQIPWLYVLRSVCLTLAVICMIAALARPQAGREIQQNTQKGIDIMLVFDISASMLAEDLKPNRFLAAKEVLKKFVSQQQGHRVGVVVFSGKSFTLIPLSTDYHLVQESIEGVFPEMVKEPGTAIGDAISNGIYRLRKQKTPSRVIVLLTDGENTAGNVKPIVAAQMARQLNIRVHTIGIGRPEGVPVPAIDRRTGRKVYLRDTQGNLYLSKIDEPELRKIASMTGGLYFRADNENSLQAIYEQINKMEKTAFETHKQTIYSEKFHWFGIPALVFLMIAVFLQFSKAQPLNLIVSSKS